ncbi:MAG: putative rane protein [Solirubrobacteraceae bacterium]|nr:putative rane protein [Solirubrobacteraceae bacterium]
MTLSVRTGRLIVLATWSAFLAWLYVQNEVARYLGPRTEWVVPFGAVVLIAATVAYARLGAQSADALRALSPAEALGLVWLLVPVLIGFAFADAALGSLAASRKLTSRGIDVSRLADSLADGASRSSVLAVNIADHDDDFAAQNGLLPGRPIAVDGFVMKRSAGGGASFDVARLYITCCVADSIPLRTRVEPVVPVPSLPRDQWVKVAGTLARDDGHLVVRAARVQRVPRPDHPYLTYRGAT